jgi:hypothetical protein
MDNAPAEPQSAPTPTEGPSQTGYLAGTAAGQRLITWTVATTNTILFVLAILLPAYASGGLSDVLPTLNTAVGVGIFLYLWALVYATTRWLFERIDPTADSARRLVLWAAAAGAVDGVAFLVGVVLVLGVPTALTTSLQLLSVALIALFGTPIAAVIGAVVGISATILDRGLLWAASRVTPRRRDRP